LITCKTPDKEKHYVGQSGEVTRRLNAHKSKLRRNIHENRVMQEDFNLYGESAFKYQKLLFGAGYPQNKLEELETTILSTLPEDARYNFYEDWHKRKATSNPFYGKKHTLEAREVQSLAKRGKLSNFAGRKQSDLVKQKISQENSGKKTRNKAVYLGGKRYSSIAEASRQTGLARQLIRSRCNSEDARFADYTWAGSFPGVVSLPETGGEV
jgi:group I intron endonuclease